MGLFDRISNVVKAEWHHRFGEPEETAAKRDEGHKEPKGAPIHPTARARRRAVTDIDSAWRVLELQPGATLDEVRGAYQDLARRYHPRTYSKVPDQAHAAQTLLEALTDALEVLEEHLLPLPRGRGA